MPGPVRDSIREIDDNSWLIGGILVLSRQGLPSPEATWTDATGSYYIAKAQHPLPSSEPLSDTTPFEKVYDAGDATAVWIFGGAVLKVKLVADPGQTREYDTLNHLSKQSLSFMVPEMYYHTECDDRYYLFLRKMPGETLFKAWPKADEAVKQAYVSQMVGICKELAMWQADSMTGFDGKYLTEEYLTRTPRPKDFRPQSLQKCCEEAGMDCSAFFFYHCDLGPENVFVDEKGIVGVIDWEMAGFVPKDWIRTKFRVSSGMDFDILEADQATKGEWRRRVQQELGQHGYPEVADVWMAWFRSRND